MMCMLTVRRLKPGAEEAFERAWAPERWHARMSAPTTCGARTIRARW